MAKWKVNALAKNKAEVVTPTVRYVVQTDSSSFRLQAFKGKRSVERVSIERKKHSYALVGVDSAGRSERQTIRIAGNRVVTRGVMGGRPFAVSSSVCLHIPLLIAKLKGRRPTRLPHTSAFFTQFKTDGRLKDQLEGRVDVALMLRAPNAVVIACVIICAECILTGSELACALCSLCLDPDPPT